MDWIWSCSCGRRSAWAVVSSKLHRPRISESLRPKKALNTPNTSAATTRTTFRFLIALLTFSERLSGRSAADAGNGVCFGGGGARIRATRLMADDLTRLLRRWTSGERDALGELFPLVYADLRRLARGALRRERAGHTLQPTALVHEAFLRLVPQQAKDWQNCEQFFAVCSGLMRQVLVDHARRRKAAKRGAGGLRVALDEAEERAAAPALEVDLLHLDRVLDELEEIDVARARVVEMRYFGGMTVPEIGSVTGRSEWDVKKDWKLAKA